MPTIGACKEAGSRLVAGLLTTGVGSVLVMPLVDLLFSASGVTIGEDWTNSLELTGSPASCHISTKGAASNFSRKISDSP